MIAGPVLCGLAFVCFFLTGPFGPCGPSSLLGFLLMSAGLISGGTGWVMCLAALGGAARRTSRSELVWPAIVAALATAALAGATASTTTEAADRSLVAVSTLVGLWPPLAAAGVCVARWLGH